MISPELLSECQELLNDIAPELSDAVYIVSAEVLEGIAAMGGDCLGWCQSPTFFAADTRTRLQDAGVWVGEPRPVIALSAEAIVEQSGFGNNFRLETLKTLIHEAAHAVEMQPRIPFSNSDIDELDTPGIRQLQAERNEASQIVEQTSGPGNKYFSHDEKFVRRCVHLYARARLAGWDIPSHDLFGPSLRRHLAAPAYVLETLLQEAVECQHVTMAEVVKMDAPARFDELWDAACYSYQWWKADPEQRKQIERNWESMQCNK